MIHAMQWRFVWAAIAWLLSLSVAAARPVNDGRTLVVADDGTKNLVNVDRFVKKLEAAGWKVEVHDEHDAFELVSLGERNYDNVLVFPTKARALGPHLSASKLMEFFEMGGSVLAVTDPSSAPESIRDFADELDVHIAPRGYQVVDHFGKEALLIEVDEAGFVGPEVIIGQFKEPLHYKGVGAYLGNSPYVIPLLRAGETAYVYDSRDEDEAASRVWVAGTQVSLGAGVQSSSNARFVWTGSAALFDDKTTIGLDLVRWAFKETGVIRTNWAEHYLAATPDIKNEKLYKVSEDIVYNVALSQWNGSQWVPFSGNDLQLEFVMLDPYYRVTLDKVAEDESEAVYGTKFKIPDQHGMFTFRFDYKRPGLSFVQESEIVTIRHVANDEWPRSWELTNSWVYVASAGSVVVAWLAFVIFYLYLGESTADDKKTK
jgi:oligosaccharyltransferase complex subunit beta